MRMNILPPLLLVAVLIAGPAFGQKQDELTAASLVGKYAQEPAENDWHKVTIEPATNGNLRWKNAAGREWTLELRGGNELWAAKDCPYGETKLDIKKDRAGKITGIQFNDGIYRLLAQPEQGGPAPIELKFGEPATLSGRIEQIKTYGDDGAVFPFYLKTARKLIVRPAADFDPGDCDEEIDGMEVKLSGADDSALEPYKGKDVTVTGRVATGVGLYCFGFGLYVDALNDIKVNAPSNTGSSQPRVTTPEPGTQLRKEICDAFRVPMTKEVNGQDIVFAIHQLNVMGDWAFIHCSLQLADGKEVDWSKTKYKSEADGVENDAAGLLKIDPKGKWSVVENSFNHTDVPWLGWGEKHGVSEKLFE